LITSLAMIAGMMPMAVRFGGSGDQMTPLARALIGGLAAATIATLFILPVIFAQVQRNTHRRSISLAPGDAERGALK